MKQCNLTWEYVIQEYIETFRHLGIFYEEPGGVVPLLHDYKGDVCFTLENETPAIVHDRIIRSKQAGRNLFFEECAKYRIIYSPNTNY